MDIGAWLAETYGQDLSGVTEIKEVPSDVTGALLFSRSIEKRLSFFLFFTDDAIEVVLAEAVNANIRISDACADTCTLFCADFSGLSALVNLTTLNLSETKIREF